MCFDMDIYYGPPDPDPDEEEAYYEELYKKYPPSQEDTGEGDLIPHYPACITDEELENEDTPF